MSKDAWRDWKGVEPDYSGREPQLLMRKLPHSPIPNSPFFAYGDDKRCGQCGSTKIKKFNADIKEDFRPNVQPHSHIGCTWCKDCGSFAADVPDCWSNQAIRNATRKELIPLMEVTANERQQAIDDLYAKSLRVRFLVGQSPERRAILDQIAQSVFAKCSTMHATYASRDAVLFECRQELKDAVGFWPIIIQILLPVIIKLLIDWFINRQAEENAAH